jgi:phosphoadenosine phosphosulfate reductase
MHQPVANEFEDRVAAVRAKLAGALTTCGRLIYSSSLGAEAIVLTDLIWGHFPEIEVFSIDTGQLHKETYELIERLQSLYRRRLRLVYPDPRDLDRLVASQRTNGIYDSVEARLECCRVRKVEPFKRAIAGFAGWITGIRSEQSEARADAQPIEWDATFGLYKISPLVGWTERDVWQYIHSRSLPYNPLHDRRYPSIGCAPCTRAIGPGEARRAGRWWWERPESRECGLHPRFRPAALIA